MVFEREDELEQKVLNNATSSEKETPFDSVSFPFDPHGQVRRGVKPSILVGLIRNTTSFIFNDSWKKNGRHDFLLRLNELAAEVDRGTGEPELDHVGYYEMCVCAHHATVASFVPTDVDNQIRFRLWHPSLSLETMRELSELVMRSRLWDWTVVSTRGVKSPESGEAMSGHQGEWFSTAAAAYGSLRRRNGGDAANVAGEIVREIRREARIFFDLRKAKDGIGMIKASTVIAHNLGDLERVFDMWNMELTDPLRETVAKEITDDSIVLAAKLNRLYGANENHRHFALRTPRCLRQTADFLLPLGPFFDDWGTLVAHHPLLGPENIAEVVEALIAGWQKLKSPTVGYARALIGIEEGFPGGLNQLGKYLPARVLRDWKSGTLRTLCSVSRPRFEEQWRQMALKA